MPAYYAHTVNQFLNSKVDEIELALIHAYKNDKFKDLITTAITAWRDEIRIMQDVLLSIVNKDPSASSWGIAFEFTTPRKTGRIDVVLLIRDAIVVLEFKTAGADSGAASQVEDYALDLLQFHGPSHQRTVYPIVVATDEGSRRRLTIRTIREGLQNVMFCTKGGLAELLVRVTEQCTGTQIDIFEWNAGEYKPVPTIVEAAIGMFAAMEVDEIAHSDTEPENLGKTLEAIREVIRGAESAKERVVCFVTGVPGAGKTLAGLSLVHDGELRESVNSDLVYLTGNLPLAKVLQTALARDKAIRLNQNLRVSSRDPKTTIDTVLSYKKAALKNERPPHEHIVVFDEAQRAWTAERTEEYLGEDDSEWIGYSEPALLMALLTRHPWAAIVALVGGGQEIHEGEAGLGEWGDALMKKFPDWKVVASAQALEGGYGAGSKLFRDGTREIQIQPSFHLDNPIRQYRGKTVARFAEELLAGNVKSARMRLEENSNYPIRITRSLDVAKSWVVEQTRGRERYGLIASSGAKRIRSEGIELPPARADGVEHWFLNQEGDIRSSFQLEVAATEFQIQGLEIDWAVLCWGGDFLRQGRDWMLSRFRGTRWERVRNEIERAYIINKYRVLLTRARKGMVLFVPRGNERDATTTPAGFDSTFEFLLECGTSELT